MANMISVAQASVEIIPTMQGAQQSIAEQLSASVGNTGFEAGNTIGSNLSDGLGGALGGITALTSQIPGDFGTMASGIITAVSGGPVDAINLIGAALADCINGTVEFKNNYYEAMGEIAIATGAGEGALKELTDVATQAWQAVAGADQNDAARAVGALNTRFQLTGEDAANASQMFLNYAKIAGVDVTTAVNDVADVMKNYGLVTGNAAQDNQTMLNILNDLTIAEQNADVSHGQLVRGITDGKAAFEDFGYSMEDATALMMAYRDNGGNVDVMLSGIQRAEKNLAGQTDDMQGALKQAFDVMGSGKSTSEILNTEIGNTGKTISDVFGRDAQKMINGFQGMGDGVEQMTVKLQNSNGAMLNTSADAINLSDAVGTLESQYSVMTGGVPSWVAAIGALNAPIMTNSAATQRSGEQVDVLTESFRLWGVQTGLTAEQERAAFQQSTQALDATINSAANAQSSVGASMSGMASSTQDAMNAISNTSASSFDGIVDGVKSKTADAKAQLDTNTSNMNTSAQKNMSNVAKTTATQMNAMNTTVSNKSGAAKTSFNNNMSQMQTKATSTANGIQSTFANTRLSFNQSIALPHFSMSGAFNAQSRQVPQVGVSWYAKAAEQGALFSKPTIIGVGDAAQPELLIGEKKLRELVGGKGVTINVYGAKGQNEQILAEKISKIIFDNVRRKQMT